MDVLFLKPFFKPGNRWPNLENARLRGLRGSGDQRRALWSNFSVDGSELYYVNQKGICKIPVSGGSEVIIAHSWSFVPAINGIYFIEADATQQSSMPLMFLDFKTQKQKTVGMLPGPVGWNIEISPGSQFFLYSKFDRRGSELMLVDHFQ